MQRPKSIKIQRVVSRTNGTLVTVKHSVSQPKPAPDLFLYAAEQLGLSPSQCLVVEDAQAGVEAAIAAGMLAVGLGPVERVGKAHIVLPSLADIRWQDLHSQITNEKAELVEAVA